MKIQVLPSEIESRGSKWVLQFDLSSDADSDLFLKSGTLDREGDERLLRLIGNQKVPLRMKPLVHEANSEKEAKDLMMRLLPELRENMAVTRLREVKRGLVGRWIETQSTFGSRESGRGW